MHAAKASRSPLPASNPRQRPSSPPPGQEFHRQGHQRSNSGSFVHYAAGGTFIPEKEGRQRSYSGRASIRSTSSTSSTNSSQGTGSLGRRNPYHQRNEDEESGLGSGYNIEQGNSRNTFPRNVQSGFNPEPEDEKHASTFPRAAAKGRTGNEALGALSLETPDSSHNRGAPTRWKRGKLLGTHVRKRCIALATRWIEEQESMAVLGETLR